MFYTSYQPFATEERAFERSLVKICVTWLAHFGPFCPPEPVFLPFQIRLRRHERVWTSPTALQRREVDSMTLDAPIHHLLLLFSSLLTWSTTPSTRSICRRAPYSYLFPYCNFPLPPVFTNFIFSPLALIKAFHRPNWEWLAFENCNGPKTDS